MRIPCFPRLLFFPLCLILLRELGFCIFSDLCVSLRKLLSIPAFSNPKIENGYLFFIYIPSDNKYLLSALCCLLEISIPFSENLCVCIYSSTVLFTKEYAFLSGMIFMWILLSLLNKCFSQSKCTNSYTPSGVPHLEHFYCQFLNVYQSGGYKIPSHCVIILHFSYF